MRGETASTSVDTERRAVIVAGLTAPFWLPDLARVAVADGALPGTSTRADDGLVATIVYENYPGPEGLIAQWGFACLIEGLEKTILFDTGGIGTALLSNMRHLKRDPKSVDAVVLSHIHWDHTGGLPSLAPIRTGIPVYMPVGFPPAFREHARSLGYKPVEAAASEKICTGARTTGTLGQGAIEEHGLCVKTREGWVLITGCAHPGADNMAAQAKTVTGGPIHTVLGGFHMIQESPARIGAVIDRFEELGVKRAMPCHCSGDETRSLFKQRLGDRCDLPGVGYVFRLVKPERR